jgi:saccharopine dehydrogenase-like NADP-dependent oxidoreductase
LSSARIIFAAPLATSVPVMPIAMPMSAAPMAGASMELIATGAWTGRGVLCPEAFDPDPFLALMSRFDFPWHVVEMDPIRE